VYEFDVQKWQPENLSEDSWSVFLYRKGQLPTAIDITGDDASEAKAYLVGG